MSAPRIVQTPPPDPVATANAQGAANVESAIATALLNQQNVVSPFGNVRFDQIGGQQVGQNFVPQFQRTIELSPEQQQQLDLQNRLGADLSQLAVDQTGRISGTLGTGLDTSGLPGLFGSVGLDPIDIGSFAPDAAAVERATFRRGLNLLRPEFDRQTSQLESTLVDRGLPIGSESAEAARDPLQRRQNDALENLSLSAVLAGRQEQGRLFGQALATRAQQFNEAAQNAAIANAARAQGIQEEAFERSLPISDIAALLGTSPGVQQPQFQPTPAVGVSAPDVIGATLGSSQIAQQNAIANAQAQSGFLGGLFGLAGDLGSAFIRRSDRRLKTDIRRIGKTRKNFNLYSYIMDGVRQIGVIAQEVARTLPEAVTIREGHLAVRYDMVS